MKKTIIGFSVCILVLCVCSAAFLSGCSGMREPIGGERAIELAAEHKGVEKDDCTVLGVELDDGKYEVKLLLDNTKYEIEVDAYTGKARTTDVEYKNDASGGDKKETGIASDDTSGLSETTAATPKEKITLEEATDVAVAHFGLDIEKCRFIKKELDGRKYEIDIVCSDKEYEAEIDAYTGKVLETSIESIYD